MTAAERVAVGVRIAAASLEARCVETKKLRMLTEEGRLEALLESLVQGLGYIPESAERITAVAELPPELQPITKASSGAQAWCAWRLAERLWFYTAQMSLEQSRVRGKAVLRVTSYSPDGEIVESGWWVRGDKWSRID